jgi:hypothetical protein
MNLSMVKYSMSNSENILSIRTRSGSVTAKVRASVASVAVLHLQLGVGLAVQRVADKHAESLGKPLVLARPQEERGCSRA